MAQAIEFHSGVPDKQLHACRLLRKAYLKGARVVVSGAPQALARLDEALWTFEPLSFVPHGRLRRGEAMPARLARTPLWLAEPGALLPHTEVLVNLGPDLVPGHESFARVIEVVSTEPDDLAAGRARWRAYRELGCAPENKLQQDGAAA